MLKIKGNINMIVWIFTIALSIVNVIIYKSDYIFRPKSYTVFLLIYFVLVCGITFLSIKYKKNASNLSRRIGSFVPLFTLIYLVTLIKCFDFNSFFHYGLLFATSFSSSMIIFFVYNKVKWLKICVAILLGIFVVFFSFVMYISALFSDFGEKTVTKTIESPGNTYVAWVVSYDQGALGGSTGVYVRNMKRDIVLVSGILKTETHSLWTGDWGEEPVLDWQDNNTIFIDGKGYEVK